MPSPAKTAVLHRMVMSNHTCPYGLKSKHLLETRGYNVDDRHLTTREQTDAFKAEHGVATTPQTFINGERIGAMTTCGGSSGSRSPIRMQPATARSSRSSP